MPEYPDVINYVEALSERVLGRELSSIELLHPFLLRSVSPTPAEVVPAKVSGVRHIGKRIVLDFGEKGCALIHLMIAGRLHWRENGRGGRTAKPLGRFFFENGLLLLTEAGSKRRASLHLLSSGEELSAFDRGGLDPLTVGLEEFTDRLRSENHTLKRSLTDPRMLSGIGNAYSDEILLRAALSPFERTKDLDEAGYRRLHQAARDVLIDWAERVRRERQGGFPEKVTAFRPEMAVHGRYGKPCPVCGTEIQRVRYAENECNYCPRCQTGGKVLADRALSRLLKEDWPRRIEELEELRRG